MREYSIVAEWNKILVFHLYDHIAIERFREVQEGDFRISHQFVIKLFDNNQEGKIDDL
ncbi:MAG: hypothetical protein ACLUD0_12675 [Eubacterium ramulus]